jgi:hypothetical protein
MARTVLDPCGVFCSAPASTANSKMDLKEVECDSMEWFNLAQDRDKLQAVENTVMKLLFP